MSGYVIVFLFMAFLFASAIAIIVKSFFWASKNPEKLYDNDFLRHALYSANVICWGYITASLIALPLLLCSIVL